jgi:hypothetical protein
MNFPLMSPSSVSKKISGEFFWGGLFGVLNRMLSEFFFFKYLDSEVPLWDGISESWKFKSMSCRILVGFEGLMDLLECLFGIYISSAVGRILV